MRTSAGALEQKKTYYQVDKDIEIMNFHHLCPIVTFLTAATPVQNLSHKSPSLRWALRSYSFQFLQCCEAKMRPKEAEDMSKVQNEIDRDCR